ncbi:MAG: c-type cytochrome [Bdellovibrionales bacterium]|nr:c-type cytochrome [Bdellovibrionales bacterium]
MRIVLVLFSFVSVAMAQELSFRAHDKEIQSVSLEALKKLAPAKDITVYEPHEKAKVTYSAIPARAVFEAVFKEDWKEADEILFTCEDGYQPSVPAAKFKKYAAYLSFAKPGKPFTMVNKLQNNEKIELGPYYLVWDNETFPALKAEGASDSPYQVVAIELVDFEKRFPGMTPPKKRSPQVERGFLAFRKNCMACHTINGDGGGKAVELNYPVNITEMLKTSWLRKWILDPTSIRFNTTMPAYNPADPKREETVKDILAYLREMRRHKRKPVPKD